MPTSYTSLLGLALPVTGELSGTWGDTVNDYITQYLDASVAGTQTISGSQTAVTLSKTTATSLSQAGSGATGSSQYNIINCTGNPASMLTVTVPAASKTYVVVNATSTNQDVKIVGAGPTTGVTLVAGEKAVIAWNGSDFIKVATSTADGVTTLSFGSTGLTPSTATSGAVTVAGTLVAANGGTGQSTYTTGDLLYATGSTALSKLGIGTNGQVLTSTGTAPQWSTLSGVAVTTFSAGTTGFTPSSATSGAVTLAGTLATTNGGTGLTSFTANGVVYASSTSALTTGSALSFNGTRFTTYVTSDTNTNIARFGVVNTAITDDAFLDISADAANNLITLNSTGNNAGSFAFQTGGSEQMRLTSTGLGIGTSSPSTKLTISGSHVSLRGLLSLDSAAGNISAQTFYINGGYKGALFADTSDNFNISNSTASGALLFNTGSGVEKMRLDSSGNLGLGVTPSAWGSAYTAFDIKRGSVFQNSASNWVGLANNAYNNGTNWIYKESTVPRIFRIQNDQFEWLTAPSGTAGNAISFTQAMTLDASGRLMVGTTTPDTPLSGGLTLSASANNTDTTQAYLSSIFAIKNTDRTTNNLTAMYFDGLSSGGSVRGLGAIGMQTTSWTDGAINSNMLFWTSGSGTVAERARITSAGNVSIGGTADRGTTVGSAALQLFNGTAPAGTLTNGVSLYSQSGDLRFMDAAGNAYQVGFRNVPQSGSAKTTSYTLATTDVGEYILINSGGSIVVPTSTFASGDVVSLFNNTTGNITITCSAPTAYIAGANTVVTSVTLATRGVATVLFITATLCVITGNVS